MIITTENLKRIAERLGSILNKNINIMDETGKIVASTDEGRVGTFHQAAKDLIDRNISEMDVYSNDSFIGSRAGINLPLSLEGKTVGVIGVTGNPEELRDIGLVIAEMAKIMIMEAAKYSRFENEEKMRQHFWEELLFGNPDRHNPSFIARGRELNIDVAKIKAISVVAASTSIEGTARSAVYERLLARVSESPLSVRAISHSLLLGEKAVFFMTKEPNPDLEEQFQEILEAIYEDTGLPLYCGISGGCSSYAEIGRTHALAEKALEVACCLERPNVCLYDKLALEILLGHIRHEDKKAYFSKIWKGFDEEAVTEMTDFLNVYFGCDCSIAETSQKLYIHKNTVQYKLKKIAELTGFDPRRMKDAAVLYLSLKIRQLN